MLAVSNLRLHKVASNRAEVMDAFPVKDQAKDIRNLNLTVDDLFDPLGSLAPVTVRGWLLLR